MTNQTIKKIVIEGLKYGVIETVKRVLQTIENLETSKKTEVEQKRPSNNGIRRDSARPKIDNDLED